MTVVRITAKSGAGTPITLVRFGLAVAIALIADLVPAALGTSMAWSPPLAVLAGGVVGLLVWQGRRTRRPDMPVLEPAHPVTTGDPGGRTPR